MTKGIDGIMCIIDLLCKKLGLNRFQLWELIAVLNRLPGLENHTIVNIGADSQSGYSIKLEIPSVESELVPNLFYFTAHERNTWGMASNIAKSVESDRFSYLGIKYLNTYQRELTFYIDIRSLIHIP